MKHPWIAGAVVLLTLICVNGKAQDKQLFNHLSLGVNVGVDGLGVDLAVCASPFVQLRAGYSIFPYTFTKWIDTDYVFEDVELVPFPASFTFWKGGNGKILLDFYPGRNTSFRFTAGVFAGPGKFIHWEAYLDDSIEVEDRGKRTFTYRGATFSTDADAYVRADAQLKHWVPYVGLGYGRAVNPSKRVSISADLGVLITGGLRVQTYNYVNNPAGEPVILTSNNLVSPGGRQWDKGWVDRAAKWPVLPLLRITVFFKLF